MSSQYGTNREYTSTDESERSNKRKCPHCHVVVVPRGITTTRKDDLAGESKSCPNCGHVFDRATTNTPAG